MKLELKLDVEKVKVEKPNKGSVYTSYSSCSCVNPPCPIRPYGKTDFGLGYAE